MAKIKDFILKHIVELAVAALAASIPVSLFLIENRLIEIHDSIESKVIVRLVVALLALLLLLCAYIIKLKPYLAFDVKSGTWINRKNNIRYCNSCKSKKLLSPLTEDETGWHCKIKDCLMHYRNPDYKEPPRRESNYQRRRI